MTNPEQLNDLNRELARVEDMYSRYLKLSSERSSPRFDDAANSALYWQACGLKAQLEVAESFIKRSISGTDSSNLSLRSIVQTPVETCWDAIVLSNYAFANAAAIDEQCGKLRQCLAKQDGSFTRSNQQSSFLKLKTESLAKSWRFAGVTDLLLNEIVDHLNELGLSVSTPFCTIDQAWELGISRLRASIENYEAALSQYEQVKKQMAVNQV